VNDAVFDTSERIVCIGGDCVGGGFGVDFISLLKDK